MAEKARKSSPVSTNNLSMSIDPSSTHNEIIKVDHFMKPSEQSSIDNDTMRSSLLTN
jgi:hypothetical protein